MSHWIYTTIELSRGKKSLRAKLLPRLLDPYFETGTCDLSFNAVLPPPPLLEEDELIAWKRVNWLRLPSTVEGEIKDGRYHFATINGYPERMYKVLAKKIAHSFFVTTCSSDYMIWNKAEYRKDGMIRSIYHVSCQSMSWEELGEKAKRQIKNSEKTCREWKDVPQGTSRSSPIEVPSKASLAA